MNINLKINFFDIFNIKNYKLMKMKIILVGIKYY